MLHIFLIQKHLYLQHFLKNVEDIWKITQAVEEDGFENH